MGLDITAYTKLREVTGHDDEALTWPKSMIDFVERNFPGRTEGLKPDVHYIADEVTVDFKAGTYSGYGNWRNQLARLAGYPKTTDEGYDHHYAAGAWAAEGGPFWELINFADNEGVIGPVVSAKLLKDFREFDERAKTFITEPADGGYFYSRYQLWLRAFEIAADGGAVDFH